MGGLLKNIEAKGMEQRAALIKSGTPNRFISIPKIGSDIWEAVMSRHPKSLAVCKLGGASEQVSALFNATTAEIYDMGDDTSALHIKIGLWHADLKAKDEHSLLVSRTLKNILCHVSHSCSRLIPPTLALSTKFEKRYGSMPARTSVYG